MFYFNPPENVRFCGVFRGYGKEKLTWNKLKISEIIIY